MSSASLPPWARKGVKVVCIEGGTSNRTAGGWAPKTNGIYTIRGVSVFPGHGACLLLREYVHDEQFMGQEWGWQADHFRPLISTKTEAEDVAEFRKLLTQPIPEAV